MKNDLRYFNWFVLHVSTGKEYYIKENILKNVSKPVQILLFSKEIIKRKNGIKKRIIHPLFPGYIFVRQELQLVLDFAEKGLKNEFIRPICFKNHKCKIKNKRDCEIRFSKKTPCMIPPDEMKLLMINSDADGLFNISEVYKQGEKIIISKGPLKKLQGNILYINEKKKIAGVEISLFNRKMKINLNFDFIKKPLNQLPPSEVGM